VVDTNDGGTGTGLNSDKVRDECIEKWDKIDNPTLDSIAKMVWEYFEEAKAEDPTVKWDDLRLWKEDLKGAFTLLDFDPEGVPFLGTELEDGLVIFYLCVLFGWTGSPMAFQVINRALVWELSQPGVLKGRLKMYTDDMIGVTLAKHLTHDMDKAATVCRKLLGNTAIADQKTASGTRLTVLGWDIDLGQRLVTIAEKNALKAFHGYARTEVDGWIPRPVVEAYASWAERYGEVCLWMRPFRRILYNEVRGQERRRSIVLSPLGRRMIAEQGLGASQGPAGGGGANTVASGASPPVKKAAFTSVNDINLDERMVANKEGAATKVRTVAALIREMHIGRLEYLCPDWEFNVDAVRERLQCQSERPMICGDEMFSLGRMMRLELLTVWKDKTKFEGWFLGRLPSACYSLSLWDFKGPESSGWGMDTSYLGRANLLEALENFDAFLGILKGDAFKRCMDPIRDLWMEPGSLVHQYHAVFLQFHLEKMIRDYYQDITMSTGKAARLMAGYALKGQTESVALLRANVDNFVTLIRSKTLEGAPHTAFYGDNKWVRITNKPAYPTSPGRSSGQGAGGGGSASGAGVRESCHREGLCIWALADMLGLQNKTGGRYVCRPVGSEPPVTHTPLNRVRRSAIVKLLEDPKFLNGARDGLKKAILTKMEAEPKLFRRE
jgi:hypothetical protein